MIVEEATSTVERRLKCEEKEDNSARKRKIPVPGNAENACCLAVRDHTSFTTERESEKAEYCDPQLLYCRTTVLLSRVQ